MAELRLFWILTGNRRDLLERDARRSAQWSNSIDGRRDTSYARSTDLQLPPELEATLARLAAQIRRIVGEFARQS
jgi:hypothetical protein